MVFWKSTLRFPQGPAPTKGGSVDLERLKIATIFRVICKKIKYQKGTLQLETMRSMNATFICIAGKSTTNTGTGITSRSSSNKQKK